MTSKPNVLLLFSDQHQAAYLGCEDHPDVMTPHLDGLAAGGIRFTRACCQDAICKPSRTSMMTGIHPQRLGVFNDADTPSVLEDIVPLSEYLSSRGYTTAEIPFAPFASRISQLPDDKTMEAYTTQETIRFLKRMAAINGLL